MKKTFIISLFLVIATAISAQTNIRYVKTDGDNAKSGQSWENAKKDIQDAINDLVNNNQSGEVWVAAGKYYPTETTMSTGSLYYKSFKIPAGITVRGGFEGTEEFGSGETKEQVLAKRAMSNDKYMGNTGKNGNLDGEPAKSGTYTNKTILCGDLNPEKPATLTWNSTKQQFDVAFYGNSYHVVWFAMNGFDAAGHANPLAKPAKLEGCVVEGGHAYTRDANTEHPHEGYGGGIYMVANSFVYNCEVRNCDASRNGGGIYMDGGGIVRRTYVHDCQALGIGTEYGLGGGVCLDGSVRNSKTNPIVMAQSAVVNCVGRLGGGVGFDAEKMAKANKYTAVINSTIVANNTASVEGGGVYTYKGGGVASSTIVNNKCNGSGVTLGGTVTGRAGGLYSRDAAYVGNTVVWGNKCEANNDVQYASTNITPGGEKSHFYYNAVSKSDNTDWSLAEKMGVLSLADVNTTTGEVGSKGYPLFFKPTSAAGYLAEAVSAPDINWQVSSESFLSYAGISTVDLDYEGLTPAPTGISYDMRFGEFNSRPSVGALISQVSDIAPAVNVTYNGVTYDKAFFVDPGFIYAEDNTGSDGDSWTTPARFLGTILDFIANQDYAPGTKVAIFVKEGVADNTRLLGSARVRETALEIPSNVSLFGSFSDELTGKDLTNRNPILTPTIISAQLMDNYDFNVAHLLDITGKKNITIDGIKLSFANSYSTKLHNTNQNGAAITLKNCAQEGGNPTIHFRNIIVSNCYGRLGTVVYADNSSADFENCVFHNNTTSSIRDNGLIYGVNGSDLRFDHCNVLRSVGHASYLDATTKNVWKNSMFYGNLREAQDNTNNCDSYSILAFDGPGVNGTNLTGKRCMFDRKSYEAYDNNTTTGINLGAGIPATSTYHQVNTYTSGVASDLLNQPVHYGLNYVYKSGLANGYPRMVNPTKNAGYSTDGDITYYGRATSFEPHNDNPVVNAASCSGTHNTWGTDITSYITRDFGGLPDIGAVESHHASADQIVHENANPDGQMAYGAVMYVRDYGTRSMTSEQEAYYDGSSWERAINGNATYTRVATHKEPEMRTESVFKGYRLKSGNYYVGVNSSNQLARTTTASSALIVKFCDNDGNELPEDADFTTAKRLKDANTGNFIYLYRSGSTYRFQLAASPTASQMTATISGSSTYTIRYTNNSNRYIYNTGTAGMANSSSTSWTFEKVKPTESVPTGNMIDVPVSSQVVGLQYAIDCQNDEYELNQDSKRQVWVGAGTYKSDPADGAPSCFVMKEGVDVLGAFPKTGNPGMEQRRPLTSTSIYTVDTNGNAMSAAEIAEYETILEPLYNGKTFNDPTTTTSVNSSLNTSGTKYRVLAQEDKHNPRVFGNENNGRFEVQYYYNDANDFRVETVWDGFTIQKGFIYLGHHRSDGGAGARLWVNTRLKNCIVQKNVNYEPSGDSRAGGLYVYGGTIENCYVQNNLLGQYSGSTSTSVAYGGGMYCSYATIYNTVFTHNLVNAQYANGGGACIESGEFYNNTVLYNKSQHGTGTPTRGNGGIYSWVGTTMQTEGGFPGMVRIYNSIIGNNEGYKNQQVDPQIGNKDIHTQRGHVEIRGSYLNTTANGSFTGTGTATFTTNLTASEIDNYFTQYKSNGTTLPTGIFIDANSYDFNASMFVNLPGGEAAGLVASSVTAAENLRLNGTQGLNMGFDDMEIISPEMPKPLYWINTTYNSGYTTHAVEATGDYAKNAAGQITVSGTTYKLGVNIGTTSSYQQIITEPKFVSLSDYTDMDYADRIQDCRVDAGAYEFNGATAIHPDETTVSSQAVFYVTPNGAGSTDASSPANAACASKLQKVIDAAGRYKLTHPTSQVIVKVANSYAMVHPTEVGEDPSNFTYYATRTTDQSSTDTRLWSTIIPRGVEVWGGYTDVPTKVVDGKLVKDTENSWNDEYNGFKNRSIIANPTYFDSYFYNKDMKINATTYHVVTFTERIFDTNGHPYLKGDYDGSILAAKSSYTNEREEELFLHMSDYVAGNVMAAKINGKTVSNRAVLDGIFVTGGNADGKSISGSTMLNANGYGGAAIVTDYAYVRNCIVTNNKATNGGAFALTNGALVSGSLIIENNADNQGGGLYVFEDGAKLSNGIEINTKAPVGQAMDYNMPHVLTSTIVNNSAKQGGGVWFTGAEEPNVRLNSVVVWQNTANDQQNVYGTINPDQPVGDQRSSEEFFPFAYSAIQNVRASGTNNQNVDPVNNKGVRFVKALKDVNSATPDNKIMAEESAGTDKYADFGYYGLTNFSILASTGMPKHYYEQLKEVIAIADYDFMGTDMLIDTQGNRKFVEIGARAIDKILPMDRLMLRLFVAKPEDVNVTMMQRMMNLASKAEPGDKASVDHKQWEKEQYYSQQGSTFANPMQSVQEALDYIKMWRTNEIDDTRGRLADSHANNLPFEIFVAKGEWHPTQDLNGNTENALGATFAIPEGVSIYGGFDAAGGNGTFYGRHFEPNGNESSMTDGKNIDDNVTAIDYQDDYIDGDEETGILIQNWSADDMCRRRATTDINGNGIIEPWELKNQTIFSGNAVGSQNSGVYHVITVVPDENVVGALPKASLVREAHNDATCDGYHDHEEGQNVRLNGIMVTGGCAYHYVEDALDEYGRFTYYQGGGLMSDGNRYFDKYNGKTAEDATQYDSKHKTIYAVGYRDIPVSIVDCKFINNQAGYGGAISSNTTIDIFASAFEQNLASYNSETCNYTEGGKKKDRIVSYPGQGGAIHATHQLTCFNTLFANNEARNTDYDKDAKEHKTFRVTSGGFKVLRGCGGAIHAGLAANIHIVNCNLVKNMANMYPAIFTMNPTRDLSSQDDFEHMNFVMTPDYSQVINTVAWGNEVNPEMLARTSDKNFQFASKLMINIGLKDREDLLEKRKTLSNDEFIKLCQKQQEFNQDYCPTKQSDLEEGNVHNKFFQECAFFCAYEEGRGFTAHNENDFRLIDYKPFIFATNQLKMFDPNGGTSYLPYQNCNLHIASDNALLEGPNFVKPSVKAGIEGYTESADWSPARISNLTDNGSGMVRQTITNNGQDYECSFDKYTAAPARSVVVNETTGYTSEKVGDYANVGAYTMTHYVASYPDYAKYMAIGTDKYMQSARSGDTEDVQINGVNVTLQRNLPRISYDPNPTHDQTFVDIGVYEYQHTRLNPTGDEVDLLWVSTLEKPENGEADGSSWDKPTSDLQRAIETLLASRNGKRKEIRVMDGTYTPTYSFTHNGTKYQSYYINTLALNSNTILPVEDANKKLYQGVKSLTIKGGYSKELRDTYDPQQYQVIIRQQESSSANTDHLFYIADATQRYGYDDSSTQAGEQYGDDNNYGAWPNEHNKQTKSLPIHVDGVTMLNDKGTTTDMQGAAIFYADYVEDASHRDIPASASSGLVTKDDGTLTVETTPKFTLSKSHIIGSGKGSGSSAVYLGTGGGSSLIYNVVFHSNAGMPLQTKTPATTINNTFALNGNLVDLVDGSKMFNSVLWRNNPSGGSWSDQVHINDKKPGNTDDANTFATTGSGTFFSHNAYTGGNTNWTEYTQWKDNVEANGETDLYTHNYNVGLSPDNADLALGPNFMNPYLEATTTDQFMQRSFELKPSFRLLNHGDNNYYKNAVTAQTSPNTDKLDQTATTILDLAEVNTTDLDAHGRPRFKATYIDLGAIEYQYDLKRVLYVDPNRSSSASSTGEDWRNPLGYGSLQDAIDLVGITYANDSSEPSYVFVKGGSSTNKDLNLMENITLRDGVQVYGGIVSSYNDYHNMKDPDNASKYKYSTDSGTNYNFNTFLADILAYREGVASSGASRTTITGIKVESNSTFTDSNPAIMDGFVVTNPAKANAPVVDVQNGSESAKIVLRNLIVTGNDLSAATDNKTHVALISNGLLYNALFHDNKQASKGGTLRVSEKGYAVNVTVEGDTYNSSGNKATADADGDNIYNSIVNSIDVTGTKGAYGNITNPHISGYFYNIADANLNYQLTENSKYIDACDATVPVGLPAGLAAFINYATDRDILGNPRLLAGVTTGSKVDRGAFETWQVDNDFICGEQGTIASNGSYTDATYAAIKKQYYPHDGSVCYIMAGKSLVIDPVDAEHEVKPTPHNPGFMLVQEGANFYGNGRPVTCAFLAVERSAKAAGNIISMPFAMNYNRDVMQRSYTEDGTLTLTPDAASAYTYDGNARADWMYNFHNAQSPCWEEVTGSVAENNAVLYVPGSDRDVLRFTAQGTSMTDYIYTETAEPYKTVTLTQYNDNETTDNGADLTSKENMGWNAIGLPYLVSEYKPYETATTAVHGDANDGKYMMHIPHTLWLYYDGTNGPDGNEVDGDGGFYSVSSWTDTDWNLAVGDEARIWLGEGFFTQTATLSATEDVTFFRPVAPASFPSSAKLRNARYYLTDGIRELDSQDASGKEIIATRYFTTNGVQIDKPVRDGITIIVEYYSDGSMKSKKSKKSK